MPRSRHDPPHSAPTPHSCPQDRTRLRELAEMIRRCQEGLRLLFDGYRYACELGWDRWEFAVEIELLYAAGLTNNDLRWLIAKGFVEHALETTTEKKTSRSNPRNRRMAMSRGSCFVLTAAGVELTQEVLAEPTPSSPPQESASPSMDVPHWEAKTHSLYWRGQLVKHFKHEAPFQEAILEAFQASSWSRYVEVTLPKEDGVNLKERLRGAIRELNRRSNGYLRFAQEGNGDRIGWRPVN